MNTITDLEAALDEIARLEVREQQLQTQLLEMHAFLAQFYRAVDEVQDSIRRLPAVKL